MKYIYIILMLLGSLGYGNAQTAEIYDQVATISVKQLVREKSNNATTLPAHESEVMLKVAFRMTDPSLYSAVSIDMLDDTKQIVEHHSDILINGQSYTSNAEKSPTELRYNRLSVHYPLSNEVATKVKYVRVVALKKSNNENTTVLITL